MTAPIDQKTGNFEQEHIVAIGGEGENAPLCPPAYEGGSRCSPCRFRGFGRRGSGRGCHRRGRGAKLTFFQRFWIRFIAFFALSTLYTHRDVIVPHFKALGHSITSITPAWISTAWSALGDVANVPFAISHTLGLLLYSALASLLITSLRARLMHKRRMRFQEWKKNGGGGHRHGHHHHLHHHRQGSQSGDERPQEYKDDVEKVATSQSTLFTVEE